MSTSSGKFGFVQAVILTLLSAFAIAAAQAYFREKPSNVSIEEPVLLQDTDFSEGSDESPEDFMFGHFSLPGEDQINFQAMLDNYSEHLKDNCPFIGTEEWEDYWENNRNVEVSNFRYLGNDGYGPIVSVYLDLKDELPKEYQYALIKKDGRYFIDGTNTPYSACGIRGEALSAK